MLEWLLDPERIGALRGDVLASAKRGDRGQAACAEAAVRADLRRVAFETSGTAGVSVPGMLSLRGRPMS